MVIDIEDTIKTVFINQFQFYSDQLYDNHKQECFYAVHLDLLNW